MTGRAAPLLFLYLLLATLAVPPVVGVVMLVVEGTLSGPFVAEVWFLTMITMLVLILYLTTNQILQKLKWFLDRRQTQGGDD